MFDLSTFINEQAKQNLRKYLHIVKDLIFFGLKLIWIPIIIAALFGIKTYREKSKIPSTYTAKITFIESTKLTASSVSPIASYYGLAGNSTQDNTSIISGILFSDAVMGKALFTPVNSDTDELLINLYLRTYKPQFFTENKFFDLDIDSLDFEQKKIYKSILNDLTSTDSDVLNFETLDIKTLTSQTKNEDLSYALVTNIYNALTGFYDENEVIGFDASLELIEKQRDESLAKLKQYQAQLAERMQRSNFVRPAPDELPDRNLQREIQLAEYQYNTFYTQYEQLKASKNQNNIGYFRLLNQPIKPLGITSPKIINDTILWSFVGFFGGLFLIFIIFIIIQLRKILISLRT